MASKGQPDKYKTHIEPYLEEIRNMALTMTEKQIAQTLGVALSTFRKHKKEQPALSDALKKGRRKLVMDLHSALIQKAKGFQYQETKVIKEDGKAVRTEVFTRYSPPDVAALNLALKNYDRENWANDPQMIAIRKEELKLRERQIENAEW